MKTIKSTQSRRQKNIRFLQAEFQWRY